MDRTKKTYHNPNPTRKSTYAANTKDFRPYISLSFPYYMQHAFSDIASTVESSARTRVWVAHVARGYISNSQPAFEKWLNSEAIWPYTVIRKFPSALATKTPIMMTALADWAGITEKTFRKARRTVPRIRTMMIAFMPVEEVSLGVLGSGPAASTCSV